MQGAEPLRRKQDFLIRRGDLLLEDKIGIMKRECFKEFIRYSSLNVLGMIGLSCYILADTFFVSKGLGANGLAALNLALPIYCVIHGVGLMVGMGGGTRYAIQKGQGDAAAANSIFSASVTVMSAFAVIFLCLGIFFSGQITDWLGADQEIYQMSKTYLQMILLFAPAFLLNNLLLCFMRNDGAPQLSMAAMLGGSFFNIVLDYVFIFPCGMGIFGAVLATGFAPIISMLILLPCFLRKKNGFHFSKGAQKKGLIRGIFACGLPSFITEASSGAVMAVFNSILLELAGNIGVAAYGIIANLAMVVLSIYTGIAQGAQPVFSRYYGEGRFSEVRRVLAYAAIAVLIISAVIYAGIFFAAPKITHIFNSEQNEILQQLAVQGMRLYFIACPFAGFTVVLSAYFAAVECTRPAQLLSSMRGFAVIIPMVFLLSGAAGVTGVWSSFPAAEMVTCAVGLGIYLKGRGRKNLRQGESG